MPDSMKIPHYGSPRVTYRVVDDHTVYVKVPVGPKGCRRSPDRA